MEQVQKKKDGKFSKSEITQRIEAVWESADGLGPTLDTPIVCCMCRNDCTVQRGFEDLCQIYSGADPVLKLERIYLAR